MFPLRVTFYITTFSYIVLSSNAHYTLYIESTNSYYKYHDIGASWIDAVSVCKAEGAQLFYPESEAEMAEIVFRWKDLVYLDNMHIGISDLKMKGVYETVDGRPIGEVFYKWASGEPSPYQQYHCVALYDHRYNTFYKYYCETYSSKYICKKNNVDENITTTTPATEVPKIDLVHGLVTNLVDASVRQFNTMERQTAELKRQKAAITAALDRQSDVLQQQARALENLANAFPSFATALENIERNMTLILNDDTIVEARCTEQ